MTPLPVKGTASAPAQPGYEGNQVLYVFDPSTIGCLYIDPEGPTLAPENILSSTLDAKGPGSAEYLAFAHFAPLLAYWQSQQAGDVFLGRIDNQWSAPIQLAEILEPDTESESPGLQWTPDDEHLLVLQSGHALEGRILDVATGTSQAWDYACDRLAISPKTSWFAVWCQARSDESYAVIEFGGDIWLHSGSPPEPVIELGEGIAQDVFGIDAIAAWSSDGKRIAYIDAEDPSGLLHIRGSDGLNMDMLPGSAYPSSLYELLAPMSRPIQWSQDSERLLVLARGDVQHPCPATTIEAGPLKGVYENNACWQVIDVDRGDVIWRLTDITEIVSIRNPLAYEQAAISGDGRYLALSVVEGARHALIVLDIDANKIVYRSQVRSKALHWASPDGE